MLYGDNIFNTDPNLKVERLVSLNDEAYSFDERVVARDTQTGEWFTARDSGCSCPTPFEDYTSREDLTGVRYNTYMRREQDSAGKSKLLPRYTYRYGVDKQLSSVYVVYRCSWDDLILEAQQVLAWTKGTATDRFYGTPPSESTIADYVSWLFERRTEAYRSVGRPLPKRLRPPSKGVLL
jgi:hypothetical protein